MVKDHKHIDVGIGPRLTAGLGTEQAHFNKVFAQVRLHAGFGIQQGRRNRRWQIGQV